MVMDMKIWLWYTHSYGIPMVMDMKILLYGLPMVMGMKIYIYKVPLKGIPKGMSTIDLCLFWSLPTVVVQ